MWTEDNYLSNYYHFLQAEKKQQQPSVRQNRRDMPSDKRTEKDKEILKPKQRMRKMHNLTYYQLAETHFISQNDNRS